MKYKGIMKKILTLSLVFIFLCSSGVFSQNQDKNIKKITNIETSYPYWSPDETKIVFQSNRNDDDTENTDGKNIKRLTFAKGLDETPIWSPDGKKIAFASEREGYNERHIYIINIDGTRIKRITNFDNQGGYFSKPQWSKDGKRILCTITKEGNVEIFIVQIPEND